MIPIDDSDARMLRRLSAYSAPTAQPETKAANVTASEPVKKYSAGDWRKAEEASNKTGSIQAESFSSSFSSSNSGKNVTVQDESKNAGSSGVSATPFTPSATPSTTIASTIAKTITAPIKTATPDIILFDDSTVPIEVMADLIFEDIGGQELIDIARTDTINGQKILYQPIKNINSINQEYNSNNILGLQKTSDKYFAGFAIKLENKVPVVSNSADGNPAYIDESGNLVIDSINLNADEQVEIQISLSGTIYETEI